jgi:23S rRNA (uracil1939-C5)-methyltransferase
MPAEQVWEYRTRVQARGEKGTLGFLEPRSKRVVPIDSCPIARPEINAVWSAVRQQGLFREREYKVELAVDAHGKVHESWNQKHASALGFTQIHESQNHKLRAWIASKLPEGGVLYDLYGGSGNLSLPIADRYVQTHCVDVGAPRENVDVTKRFRFHRAPVSRWISEFEFSVRPARAVLDPPREGLGEDFSRIQEGLKRLGVDACVLVGCDVDAWARDLQRMVKKGWRIAAIGSIDFFPQTHHLESVALLRL